MNKGHKVRRDSTRVPGSKNQAPFYKESCFHNTANDYPSSRLAEEVSQRPIIALRVVRDSSVS